MSSKTWDVFISHASEDKEAIVKPVAEMLASLGAKVWYDSFTLEIGDSLSQSIDRGLNESRFGVVVLSPAFLGKDWPEYELRGLVAKELGRDKVILPIWHNVDRDQVLAFSPPLADKLALKTVDHSVEAIVLRVLGVIRPDLLDYVHARVAERKAMENAELKMVNPKTLKLAPIRHDELPDDLVGRIRLIRAALIGPDPQTMAYWLDGFKRDMNPQKEIPIWEHIAACYLEYVAINNLSRAQHRAAFNYAFGVVNGTDEERLEEHAAQLPAGSVPLLRDACRSKLPAYEIRDLPATLDESLIDEAEEELEELKENYEAEGT